MRFALLLLALPGCFWISERQHRESLDPDADGVPWPDDCNDDDPAGSTWATGYDDVDGDGWGDHAHAYCGALPEGVQVAGGDCADDDPAVNPGAVEVCGGGDEDCDGNVDDEDASVEGKLSWYADSDGDGYGTGMASITACTAPGGFASRSGDCNDGDGAIRPNADETCDGADNDCDELTDDLDPGLVDAPMWYLDADQDQYGNPELAAIAACVPPSDRVADGTDCDDADPTVHPYTAELCNGHDDNCDALTDDQDPALEGAPLWYADLDRDNYGDPGLAVAACVAPTDAVDNALDCNDALAYVNPGAPERCSPAGYDEDCDGLYDAEDPDEPLDGELGYTDADGDSFGADDTVRRYCAFSPGISPVGGDCDDGSGLAYPGAAPEVVGDGVDTNCDAEDFVCGASTFEVPAWTQTISQALALACDGDTIAIAGGTWSESLVVDVDVALIAADPTAKPVIDGGGARPLLLHAGSASNLALQNGSADVGGCVLVDNAAGVTLTNLDAAGCTATTRGGALAIQGSTDVTVVGFSANDASAPDGGCADFTDVIGLDVDGFDGTLCVANGASGAGGGIRVAAGDGALAHVTIQTSSATERGGGVAVEGPGGALDLTDLTVEGCEARVGGGVSVVDTATRPVTLTDATLSLNDANTLNTEGGGGLYARGAYALALDGVTLNDNASLIAGGGIYAHDVAGTWSGLAFADNASLTGDGAAMCASVAAAQALDVSNLRSADDDGPSALFIDATSGTLALRDVDVRVTPPAAADVGIYLTGDIDVSNVLVAGTGVGWDLWLDSASGALTQITAVGANVGGIRFASAGAVPKLTNAILAWTGAAGIYVDGAIPNVAGIDAFGDGAFAPCAGSQCALVAPLDSVDPDFVTWFPTLDAAAWDLHARGAIDAGIASVFDPDGSAGDLGYYGGPGWPGDAGWWTDADADGLPDGWERDYGFYPDLSAPADDDADGLTNAGEYLAGTFPEDADSDNDGALDGFDAAPLDVALW